MSNATRNSAHASVDPAEISRFNALAADWWNPDGPSRPLFALGPARLAFIRDQLCHHFQRDPSLRQPLTGLRLLDLGCGGGLVAEPLARLGAAVTGIDAAADNIAVAGQHADMMELAIDYRATSAESLVASGARFDAVISLEVVEHVADLPAFLGCCAALLPTGAPFLYSTLNRTARSYAAAIIAAEHILRWVPRGTHHWSKFITPDEMSGHLTAAGFDPGTVRGLSLDLMSGMWRQSSDTSINYIGSATRAR